MTTSRPRARLLISQSGLTFRYHKGNYTPVGIEALRSVAAGADAGGDDSGPNGAAGANGSGATSSVGGDASHGVAGSDGAAGYAAAGQGHGGAGGTSSSNACIPKANVPLPVATSLKVQPSCAAPAACGGAIEDTAWAYSAVCLEQGSIFKPVYDECPTSKLNGPADIVVSGSLEFQLAA